MTKTLRFLAVVAIACQILLLVLILQNGEISIFTQWIESVTALVIFAGNSIFHQKYREWNILNAFLMFAIVAILITGASMPFAGQLYIIFGLGAINALTLWNTFDSNSGTTEEEQEELDLDSYQEPNYEYQRPYRDEDLV